MIRSQPVDPRDYDPRRFPWGSAIAFVLILVALMTGGTHLVEARWGVGASVTYMFFAAFGWLVAVVLWIVFRPVFRRNRKG